MTRAVFLHCLATCGALVCMVFASMPASALPVGREWTPYSRLEFPQVTGLNFLGMPLFVDDSSGSLSVAVDAGWDTATVDRRALFTWRDSAWVLVNAGIHSSASIALAAVGAGRRRPLAWLTPSGGADLRPWLAIAEYVAVGPASGDSVFKTSSQSTEWGAAFSARRRWAVRSEQRQPELEFHVRVFYSDTIRSWHEVERLGVDEDHCTIAPLGDTTAMAVYAGASGLQYSILDGVRWSETGNIDPRPFNAAHPRLRLRASGGLWLFWAARDWLHMSTYRNGAWERGDSLQYIPTSGETYSPSWLDAEHDTTEYPAIGWTNSGYGYTYREATAIALSTGHGWESEEVPSSDECGWFAPTLTHDRNDDLWLMWRRAREGTNRWIHTYCSATAGVPIVSAHGFGTRLIWALSSRAPRSRWTIERALGDAPFDSIGTVRADEDSVLTFDDSSAVAGERWRYRVRRECLDVRYLWWSDIASYWRPDTREAIRLSVTNPSSARCALQLDGASGALDLRLYDLQGRLAHRQQFAASGTGDDSITLDLGATGARSSGIYFLRVTDSTGRASRTARVVVVR